MNAAATAPRLTGGLLASLALHGGLVAAFLFLRGAPTPESPVYRVRLVAGPAGERVVGVVQPEPTPQPVTPPPAATKTPPAPKKVVPTPTAKKKTAPKQATPTPPTKTAEKTPPATQPAAGGGPVGGKGADVATIDTPGIEFPYPYYIENITRRIIQAFGTSSARYTAEVRFIIKRDGSVDPASIQLVTSDGNFSFRQKAVGAVEAVANAKLFGPLPGGFREDILPVTFRFSPSLWR